VLTISSLDCVIDTGESGLGIADYVLATHDRPAAFASGSYYKGDEASEADGPATWHGSDIK
jgi:hypothetical protein